MVNKKRVIIISHPAFDGEDGIKEAGQYASVLLEGIKATREHESPNMNEEERRKFREYLSEFKFYTRNIDGNIL